MGSSEQPRILIVRLSAIGDIVVTTTLLNGLRAQWPKAHIGWLVESRMASLLRGHPAIDRLHEWKRTEWSADARRGRIDRALRGAIALRRELRAEKYDIALDAQGLLKSSLLAALSGARERWVLRPREGAAWVAHHSVARRDRELPGDEYRDLLRALKVGDAAANARMRLDIPDAARAKANELLRAALGDARFAVICPFTTRPQKHWFDERWRAELATPAWQSAVAMYAARVASMEEGERTASGFLQWFNATLGASDLAYLTRQQEPDTNHLSRVRAALHGLPSSVREAHVAEFGRAVASGMDGIKPELKPRYLRAGLQVVGEHPSVAEVRKVVRHYDDLLEEVVLDVRLDGPAEVGQLAATLLGMLYDVYDALDRMQVYIRRGSVGRE